MKKILAGDGTVIGRGSRVYDWGRGEYGRVTEVHDDGIVRVEKDDYPGASPDAVPAEYLSSSS